MLDCTTDSYDTLYARWLEKPGQLLDWAGYDPREHQLLDLAGGTGAVAKEALRRGAERVWLLDLNPRVNDPRIERILGRAENLRGGPSVPYNPLEADESQNWPLGWSGTDRRGRAPWNLVVCRQALGYLELPRLARNLWSVVKPGGRFVFNAFSRPRFALKMYKHAGKRFFEVSGYLGKRVFHLQARVGGGIDVTSFRWHTNEEILAAFTAKNRWRLDAFENKGASLRYSFCKLA